jgi:hypothetical protein
MLGKYLYTIQSIIAVELWLRCWEEFSPFVAYSIGMERF